MTNDLLSENRVSMTELARQEKITLPTVWRWRQRGVRGVRLETFMVGGRRFTTQEAHRRFVEAVTAAADGPHLPEPTASARPPLTVLRSSLTPQAFDTTHGMRPAHPVSRLYRVQPLHPDRSEEWSRRIGSPAGPKCFAVRKW